MQTDFTQVPGEDPIIQPGPEPDPCEDEIVIEVPENPGGGGSYVGGGGSGDGSIGGGGNGSPIPDDDLSWTNCFEWITIPCTGNGEHFGGVDSCTGSFQGATYLINTCNNTVNNLYGRNNDFGLAKTPCDPIGNIGVLFPVLFHLLVDANLLANFPCQANIVQDAYGVCSDFNEAFLSVFEGSETHSVTYVNDASITGNGATDPEPHIVTNPDGSTHYHLTIRIQDDYLNTATDLAIATTIIHENLHAILLYLQHSGFIDTGTANPTYSQLLYAYSQKLILLGELPATSEAHHEFMSQFVSDISSTLKAYGLSKGYNLSDDFYNAMGWAGLMETSTFQALYPAPGPNLYHPQHVLINNTIASEENNQNSTDYYGNTIYTQGTVPTAPCP